MTDADIQLVVTEIERRWRERTPATQIHEMVPEVRVGRSEMRLWCNEQGIAYDDLNENYEVANARLFMRLRAEFPDEIWDKPCFKLKDLCRKHGIKIPPMKRKQQ